MIQIQLKYKLVELPVHTSSQNPSEGIETATTARCCNDAQTHPTRIFFLHSIGYHKVRCYQSGCVCVPCKTSPNTDRFLTLTHEIL